MVVLCVFFLVLWRFFLLLWIFFWFFDVLVFESLVFLLEDFDVVELGWFGDLWDEVLFVGFEGIFEDIWDEVFEEFLRDFVFLSDVWLFVFFIFDLIVVFFIGDDFLVVFFRFVLFFCLGRLLGGLSFFDFLWWGWSLLDFFWCIL